MISLSISLQELKVTLMSKRTDWGWHKFMDESLKSKCHFNPPTVFDSSVATAVNSPPLEVSYRKINACEEDKPKGEMSQSVASGELKKTWKKRRNWKAKGKTGQGSDKRVRGGLNTVYICKAGLLHV